MGGGFWYDPHVHLECLTLYSIPGLRLVVTLFPLGCQAQEIR